MKSLKEDPRVQIIVELMEEVAILKAIRYQYGLEKKVLTPEEEKTSQVLARIIQKLVRYNE